MKTIRLEDLSQEAQARVLKPKFRGRFSAEDSAKTQWGLISASSHEGSIYWLIDMESKTVKDTRFLSYGQLSSLPLLDVWSEMVIDKSFEDACHVQAEILCEELNFESSQDLELNFIRELQDKVYQKIDQVVVEKPIEEKDQPYRRKELGEMNEADKAWIPLSAPQKIASLEKAIQDAIQNRSEYQASDVMLYNIERDLNAKIRLSDQVDSQHRPTLIQFMAEHCRSQLHPQITIEEV